LLGDGSEPLPDSADADMFDHSEEDKDSENQINKGSQTSKDEEAMRSEREGTPAPQDMQRTESPSSTQTEESEKAFPSVQQAADAGRKPDKAT
jgi:protein phosphatase PTC2/3